MQTRRIMKIGADKTTRSISVFLVVVFIFLTTTVAASDKDVGYSYDAQGRVVPAPNSYTAEQVITGDSLGIGSFSGAVELFVEPSSNQLYVLDSGNSRIIVLNANLELVKVIDTFQGEQQETLSPGASGLFVTNDKVIYIADTGNDRVILTDYDGNIEKIFLKPQNQLIDPAVAYQPTKIVVDSSGIMYVISANISGGALAIDQNGEFICFYGANRIQSTWKLLQELFWRKFLSRSQAAAGGAFVPIAYSNFDIDQNDFIYTVTSYSGEGGQTGQLKKLNPRGNNLFPEDEMYGEYSLDKTKLTSFVAVDVDEFGFITALDGNNGKLFVYDKDTTLLCVFGGKGDTLGTFKQPVATVSMNEKIFVLDSGKNYITVFKPTYFFRKIREATIKYNSGLFVEALEPWKEVVSLDSNYQMAYVGIARAQQQENNYVEAMKNYKIGGLRKPYSYVKKLYRNQWAREHFSLLAAGVLLIIVLVYMSPYFKKPIFKKHIYGRGRR